MLSLSKHYSLIQATLSEGLGTRRNSRRETWEIVDDLPGKRHRCAARLRSAHMASGIRRDAATAVSTNP